MQDISIPLPDIQETKDSFYQFYKRDIIKSFKRKKYTSKKNVIKTSENKLLCESCKKVFSTTGSLKNHIMIVHENYRPYKCTFPNCKKEYGRQDQLIVHERTHTGVKPFICHICKKSFNEKGNLKMHLKAHSKKTFKCLLCQKSFKSSKDLEEHINNKQINKFRCQFCNKNFGKIGELKSHIIKHKKENQFKCKFKGCGKCYVYKGNMENHYVSHIEISNDSIRNTEKEKTYGPKETLKDFEEKIKITLNKSDSINNKNNGQIKPERKKEDTNKIDNYGKNEKSIHNCFEDIYNDLRYLNYLNNSNLINFLNPPNSFPLIFNKQPSNNNGLNILNDEAKINVNNFMKSQMIQSNNYFIKNNVY